MNKTEFITALAEKTGYSEEKCAQINAILEDTLIIGKHHKEELVDKFQNQLSLSVADAEKLYETTMGLIGAGVKDKLRHPFGSQE